MHQFVFNSSYFLRWGALRAAGARLFGSDWRNCVCCLTVAPSRTAHCDWCVWHDVVRRYNLDSKLSTSCEAAAFCLSSSVVMLSRWYGALKRSLFKPRAPCPVHLDQGNEFVWKPTRCPDFRIRSCSKSLNNKHMFVSELHLQRPRIVQDCCSQFFFQWSK